MNARPKDDPGSGKFQPGNRLSKGRPPVEYSITELVRTGIKERPRIIERWLDLAESPDGDLALKAIISLVNRVEGMPKQAADITARHADDDPWLLLQQRLLAVANGDPDPS